MGSSAGTPERHRLTDDADALGRAWRQAMDRGDDEAAHAVADQVLAARDPATRDDPALPYHERWVWDGRPFDRRHVLVRCYHGLGDTLQFARFLPALRARAASVTLEVQPELLPLLAAAPGVDRVIRFRPAAPAPASACDLEIMELAHALRLRPDAALPPTLHVAPAYFGGTSIGICWRAGGWNPARSVKPALLTALSAGGAFVSLVPGRVPTSLAVLNPQGCPTNIAATAALVAGCDLVITVDTMIAHLAGALNRPTWLLLPHDPDWRWMRHVRRSRWYPAMRLYRQSVPGDWAAVIAAMGRDLTFGPAAPPAASGAGSAA